MKKCLIWGTGHAAVNWVQHMANVKIIAFVDSFPRQTVLIYQFGGREEIASIIKPEDIYKFDYDILIVASTYNDEIRQKCDELQLDFEKIVFVKNCRKIGNVNANLEILEDVVESKVYEELLSNGNLLPISCMSYDSLLPSEFVKFGNHEQYEKDYVRFRTFELVADMIQQNDMLEKGAVAEAGVFRGDFAKLINLKFPKQKLYLFDTFESFSEEESTKEIERGNITQQLHDYFKDTNSDFVLSIMPNKENCIIRKGLFPDTAKGIEEEFSFVSLDMDLEDSIFAGLEYFYPRMLQGGYIFIHEYNCHNFAGVKNAVERYEKENGVCKKIPLCDQNGTLVIIK